MFTEQLIRNPEKEISIVHLTWDELQHLLYFPFESEKYHKVRDFFVLL
jgi:hypothetical protein